QGGALDWARASRLTSRLAAQDVGLMLCLGGTVLASLPVIIAGNPEQRSRFFGRFRCGEMAGLGLSEWDHGSDLAAIEPVAEPLDEGGRTAPPESATHFRLRGAKAPINNGSRGGAVVVLARVAGVPGDPAFAMSLFLLERETPGLEPHDPVPWQ